METVIKKIDDESIKEATEILLSGGLIGMFSVAFVKNGKIGRNRRMYAKKAKAAEERELLKEQLLKDYLDEQKNNSCS